MSHAAAKWLPGRPTLGLPARSLQHRHARQSQQMQLRSRLLVIAVAFMALLALLWSSGSQGRLRVALLASALCDGAQSVPAASMAGHVAGGALEVRPWGWRNTGVQYVPRFAFLVGNSFIRH